MIIAYGIEAKGCNGAWFECANCFAKRTQHNYDTLTELTEDDINCNRDSENGPIHCDACGRVISTHDPLIGEFIRIPAWSSEGMVIDVRQPMLGTERAIEVLVEADIDDPHPRWYRLEPDEYEFV